MRCRNRLGLFALLFIIISLGGCAPAHTFTGVVFDDLQPVGDLRGTTHLGTPFDLADLQGKLVLVFFGYTFCPDVCPMTLADVAGAMRIIADEDPKAADSLAALFVTIDPERDTVERLAQYVPAFHSDIVGVIVDPPLLDAVKSSFGVYAARSEAGPSSETGYLMDHTAGIYLIDRKGDLLALFSHDTPADVLAADLKVLLKR
jgi:protein SCO1/2